MVILMAHLPLSSVYPDGPFALLPVYLSALKSSMSRALLKIFS